jgi:hypothetical protein
MAAISAQSGRSIRQRLDECAEKMEKRAVEDRERLGGERSREESGRGECVS